MVQIKREAGDKTKGFTLQKQRAIALFFGELERNPNAHVSVAIEYKGDVYLQNDQFAYRYIEEQKNYNHDTSFTFNSPQIINTLVYFLEIWLSTHRSENLAFGFYSTNKIGKESTKRRLGKPQVTPPKEGVLLPLTNKQYDAPNLLAFVKTILSDEYKRQYKTNISVDLDEDSTRSFLSCIRWYFEQDNEIDYKEEVINKIKSSSFSNYLTRPDHAESVYARFMLALEEKQNEDDYILKFIDKTNVKIIFLEISNGHPINPRSHKYFDNNYTKPDRYIERHLTKSANEDYWGKFYGIKTLEAIVADKLKGEMPVQLIIKASAGQGKSMELNNIGYKLKTIQPNIIALRLTIKNYTTDLNTFISRQYPFYEKLDKSSTMLLIDGLDEVDAGQQQKFLSEFGHMVNANPELHTICTIRSNFDSRLYSGDKTSFDEYYIQPLDDTDVNSYIDQYSSKATDVQALIKKPWLKNIIHIPFYLNALVDLSNENANLPTGLRELYQRIIDLRLEDDYLKYRGRIDKEKSYRAMSRLAIYMTLQGRKSIQSIESASLTQLNKEDFKTNPFLTLYEDKYQTHIGFVHNNFQEFLCADWLSNLKWENISNIIFHTKTGFLNTKLLNTASILFSILEVKDDRYKSLIKAIKDTDYTFLFRLEKEKLPYSEKLSLFKSFVLGGKNQMIYNLKVRKNAL